MKFYYVKGNCKNVKNNKIKLKTNPCNSVPAAAASNCPGAALIYRRAVSWACAGTFRTNRAIFLSLRPQLRDLSLDTFFFH